jgi:hypothetical protein
MERSTRRSAAGKTASGLAFLVAACAGSLAFGQADVVLTDSTGTTNYGLVGGIRGYSIGSNTCNIGNQNLTWNNNGTPGLAMNVYRIADGRLVQIGMSHVKHACCAAAGNGCGLSCNGQGGSVLGAGCLDVYSSSWNGGQGRLGPRSAINPYSGAFTALSGTTGTAVFKRLQVLDSDLSTTTFPGSQYFIEGVYVCTNENVAPVKMLNNASYKRVNLDNSTKNLTPTGTMQVGTPAIQAWRDHGLGVGLPDTSVTVGQVDVPSEGRFWFAHKARSLGGGQWRYEYAIFNLNSDRAGGALTIPVPAGVNVTNVGFSAPDYHSSEVIAGGVSVSSTDWTNTRGSADVQWATTSSIVNPGANAIRWGLMYNFWFDANTAPASGTVNASLGLFKLGTPAAVTFAVTAPGSPALVCDTVDFNRDGLQPDSTDLDDFIAVLGGGPGACSNAPNCGDIDFNNDSLFPDSGDLDAFISRLGGGACI